MSSKYTNPTGEGYIGVWSSDRWCVAVPVGDRFDGDEVYAVDEGGALAIVDERPPEYVTECAVYTRNDTRLVRVPSGALQSLEMERGDDVRAYERDGAVTLVPVAADPYVEDHG